MKKDFYNILVFGILIIAASLLATSCTIRVEKRDDGKTITTNSDVKTPFKGIVTMPDAKLDIIYTQSDSVSVKFEGPENLVKNYSVKVSEDSILWISSAKGDDVNDFIVGLHDGFSMTTDGDRSVKVYISAPALSSLDLKGATKFTVNDTINVPSMKIKSEGAAEIDIKNIVADTFSAVTSGSAEINIGSLKAETATLETSGAGDVEVDFVGVKDITFTSQGASEAKFGFTDCDTANINVMGAADVELKGNLHHLNKNIAGAGEIDDDELKVKE